MSKLFDYWMKLSIRVILLFATTMLVSFSPDYLREFFGDTPCTRSYCSGLVDPKWDWGFRHVLYQIMCISLFALQAIRIFSWIESNTNKFEP